MSCCCYWCCYSRSGQKLCVLLADFVEPLINRGLACAPGTPARPLRSRLRSAAQTVTASRGLLIRNGRTPKYDFIKPETLQTAITWQSSNGCSATYIRIINMRSRLRIRELAHKILNITRTTRTGLFNRGVT